MKIAVFLKESFIPILTVIVLIFSVIGGVYLIHQIVENKVEQIVNSEAFEKNLISKIHPYIIFNENNSILNDVGGMKYIDYVKVFKGLNKYSTSDSIPIKIVVKPKVLLSSPPLIECLDHGDIYIFTPRRGEGFLWIYKIELQQYDTPRKTNRFKLEIIK